MTINNRYNFTEEQLDKICDLLHIQKEIVTQEEQKERCYSFCYANCDGSYNKYVQAN